MSKDIAVDELTEREVAETYKAFIQFIINNSGLDACPRPWRDFDHPCENCIYGDTTDKACFQNMLVRVAREMKIKTQIMTANLDDIPNERGVFKLQFRS